MAWTEPIYHAAGWVNRRAAPLSTAQRSHLRRLRPLTAVCVRNQSGQQLLLEPPRERLECSLCGSPALALIADRTWGDLECEACRAIPLPEAKRFHGPARVKRRGAPRQGFVYFVQAGTEGLVKIGFAVDPRKRLEALQTSSPIELRVVHVREGTSRDEFELHRKYALLRERREWFRPAVLELEGLA